MLKELNVRVLESIVIIEYCEHKKMTIPKDAEELIITPLVRTTTVRKRHNAPQIEPSASDSASADH